MRKILGYRSFVIDLEGTLYVGSNPVEGAQEVIECLRKKGYKFRFVTNTTRRSRSSLCKRLQNFGFKVSENEIFSAPVSTAYYVKKRAEELGCEAKCFLLTTGDTFLDFMSLNITLTEENPSFVVVGDAGEKFTHETLTKAFRFIMQGAELVAMEKDRYWMSSNGLELSAGPFVSALEYATGKKAILVGKPSKDFFLSALNDMNVKPEEAVVVGDDIFSDITGGKKLGMLGILVKTGKYKEEDVIRAEVKPDFILPSISSLRDLI
jgi:HAD superfamily hydrolase (TIGR01458 family)